MEVASILEEVGQYQEQVQLQLALSHHCEAVPSAVFPHPTSCSLAWGWAIIRQTKLERDGNMARGDQTGRLNDESRKNCSGGSGMILQLLVTSMKKLAFSHVISL